MFENEVAYYLNKYLGTYVAGIDKEKLKISVWNGDVELRNLSLKPEALRAFKLPINVKAGYLGSLKLRVNWARLGSVPVVVDVDKLYVLLSPYEELSLGDKQGDSSDMLQQQKMLRVNQAEDLFKQNLKFNQQDEMGSKGGESTEGQNLSSGVCFKNLSAKTLNEKGADAYVTSDPNRDFLKAIELQSLLIYMDVGGGLIPDDVTKAWQTKNFDLWNKNFIPAINGQNLNGDPLQRDEYVIRPVNCKVNYFKSGLESLKQGKAAQSLDVKLQEVLLHQSVDQYRALQNLLNQYSMQSALLPFRHLRPNNKPRSPQSIWQWWQYALQASIKKELQQPVSIDKMIQICKIRKAYIQKYAELLKQNQPLSDDIKDWDKQLPEPTIIVFRKIAHVQFHTYLSTQEEKKRQHQQQLKDQAAQRSWYAYMFGGPNQANQAKEQEQATSPGEEGGVQPPQLNEDQMKLLNKLVEQSNTQVDEQQRNPNFYQQEMDIVINQFVLVLFDRSQFISCLLMQDMRATFSNYTAKSRVKVETGAMGLLCKEGFLFRTSGKPFTKQFLTENILTSPSRSDSKQGQQKRLDYNLSLGIPQQAKYVVDKQYSGMTSQESIKEDREHSSTDSQITGQRPLSIKVSDKGNRNSDQNFGKSLESAKSADSEDTFLSFDESERARVSESPSGRKESLQEEGPFHNVTNDYDFLGSLADNLTTEKAIIITYDQNMEENQTVNHYLDIRLLQSYLNLWPDELRKVQDFFKTQSNMQFLAIEAQAAAQVQKVQKYAQRQIRQAFKKKSNFFIKLDFDTPKLAISVNKKFQANKELTLVLDLGKFEIQSKKLQETSFLSLLKQKSKEAAKDNKIPVEEQSKFEEQAFQCFKVKVSDIQAFMLDTDFNWDRATNIAKKKKFNTPTNQSDMMLQGYKTIELLNRFAINSDVCVAMAKTPIASEREIPANLLIDIQLDEVNFFLSPGRYARMMTIINYTITTMMIKQQFKGGELESFIKEKYPQNEHICQVLMLQRSMIVNKGQWRQYIAILQQGKLYFWGFGQGVRGYEKQISFWNYHFVKPIPEELIGQKKFCLAFQSDDTLHPIDDPNSIIISLANQEGYEEFRKIVTNTQSYVENLVSGNVDQQLADNFSTQTDESQEVIAQTDEPRFLRSSTKKPNQQRDLFGNQTSDQFVMMLLQGTMKQLNVHLAGRVTDNWWPRKSNQNVLQGLKTKDKDYDLPFTRVDQEMPIIVIQFINTQVNIKIDDSYFFVDASLVKLNIQDYLVGLILKKPIFLALSEKVNQSGQIDTGQESKLISFKYQWSSFRSKFYGGIDNILSVQLSDFSVYVHRPTVASLVAFGLDVNQVQSWLAQSIQSYYESQQGAFEDQDDSQHAKQEFDEVTLNSEVELISLSRQQQERIIFKMDVDMKRLHFQLDYESEVQDTLAQANVQNFHFVFLLDAKVMDLQASLGNLQIIDNRLRRDNPYRWVCNLKQQENTSFIQFNYRSHQPISVVQNLHDKHQFSESSFRGSKYLDTLKYKGRIPHELTFNSISLQLTQVNLTFLNRFVQEFNNYMIGMFQLEADQNQQPYYISSSNQDSKSMFHDVEQSPHPMAFSPHGRRSIDRVLTSINDMDLRRKESQNLNQLNQSNKPPYLLLFDVDFQTPQIDMPENSFSQVSFVTDLGNIKVQSSIGYAIRDRQKILLSNMGVTLQNMKLAVVKDRKEGPNLLDQVSALDVNICRQLTVPRAPTGISPPPSITELQVNLPKLIGQFTDNEYHFIVSVYLNNMKEEKKLPDHGDWIEEMEKQKIQSSSMDIKSPKKGILRQRSSLKYGVRGSQSMQKTQSGNMSGTFSPRGSRNDKSSSQRGGDVSFQQPEQSIFKFTFQMQQGDLLLLNQKVGNLDRVPLGRLIVKDLWVQYQSNLQEGFGVNVIIPVLKAYDSRPQTPPSLSLVLSSTQIETQYDDSNFSSIYEDDSGYGVKMPSMLHLHYHNDAKVRKHGVQMYVQRPTLVAETSFVAAILKYFYPQLTIGSKLDYRYHSQDIFLSSLPYKAQRDIWLSPSKRILADGIESDHYVFDGQGHNINLPPKVDVDTPIPLIFVGANKTLSLHNVTIIHSNSLPHCVKLAPQAQIVIQQSNGVKLLFDNMLTSQSSLLGNLSRRISQGQDTFVDYPDQDQQYTFDFNYQCIDMGVHLVDTEYISKHAINDGNLGNTLQGHNSNFSRQSLTPQITQKQFLQQNPWVQILAVHFDLEGRYLTDLNRQETMVKLLGMDIKSEVVCHERNQHDQNDRWNASQRNSLDSASSLISTLKQSRSTQKNFQSKDQQVITGRILEPCNLSLNYSAGNNTETVLHIDTMGSNIKLQLAPDVLQLFLKLQTSIIRPFMSQESFKPLAHCTSFHPIWNYVDYDENSGYSSNKYLQEVKNIMGQEGGFSVWRPQPKKGYAILGDVICLGKVQPSQQINSVSVSCDLIAPPLDYKKVFELNDLILWEPIPPENYTALGCIATINQSFNEGRNVFQDFLSESVKPERTQVFCVRKEVVVQSTLSTCFYSDPQTKIQIWGASNSVQTFVVMNQDSQNQVMGLDFRQPIGQIIEQHTSNPNQEKSTLNQENEIKSPKLFRQKSFDIQHHLYSRYNKQIQQQVSQSNKELQQSVTIEFQRVWWNKNLARQVSLLNLRSSENDKPLTFWRPIPPQGYVSLGDCIVQGYHPPNKVVVFQDSNPVSTRISFSKRPLITRPVEFKRAYQAQVGSSLENLTIWKAIPPQGYVAIGMLVTSHNDYNHDPMNQEGINFRCIRDDAVQQHRGEKPLSLLELRNHQLGIWSTDLRLQTFSIERGQTEPIMYELLPLHLIRNQLQDVQRRSVDSSRAELSQSPDYSVHQNSFQMVVKTQTVCVQLQDSLRTPLVEGEFSQENGLLYINQLGSIAYKTDVKLSLHFFNAQVLSWEPIIDPLQMFLEYSHKAVEEKDDIPLTKLKLEVLNELMFVTIAHAAIQALSEAFKDFISAQDLKPEDIRHKLLAADSSTIETTVVNQSGVDLELNLNFGNYQKIIDLSKSNEQTVQMPLVVAPVRNLGGSKAQPPSPILGVHLNGITLYDPQQTGTNLSGDQQWSCYMQLPNQMWWDKYLDDMLANSEWKLRTRPQPLVNLRAMWNEKFLISMSENKVGAENKLFTDVISFLHFACDEDFGISGGNRENFFSTAPTIDFTIEAYDYIKQENQKYYASCNLLKSIIDQKQHQRFNQEQKQSGKLLGTSTDTQLIRKFLLQTDMGVEVSMDLADESGFVIGQLQADLLLLRSQYHLTQFKKKISLQQQQLVGQKYLKLKYKTYGQYPWTQIPNFTHISSSANKINGKSSSAISQGKLIVPIDEGIVYEKVSEGDTRKVILKSTCEVTNYTQISLEVRMLEQNNSFDSDLFKQRKEQMLKQTVKQQLQQQQQQRQSSSQGFDLFNQPKQLFNKTLKPGLGGLMGSFKQGQGSTEQAQNQQMQTTGVDSQSNIVEEIVYEHQRLQGSDFNSANLIARVDPKKFYYNGQQYDSNPNVQPPQGFQWFDPKWSVKAFPGQADEQGWQYAYDFNSLNQGQGHNQRLQARNQVRRRNISRIRIRTQFLTILESQVSHQLQQELNKNKKENFQLLGLIQPGKTTTVPYGYSMGNNILQFRPIFDDNVPSDYQDLIDIDTPKQDANDNFQYKWNEPVKSSLQGSKQIDLNSLKNNPMQTLIHRCQLTNNLQEHDIFFTVNITTLQEAEKYNLSNIVIRPPFTLSNQLPMDAKYVIRQQTDSNRMLKVQEGMVKALESVKLLQANVAQELHIEFNPVGYKCNETISLTEFKSYKDFILQQSAGKMLRLIGKQDSLRCLVSIESDQPIENLKSDGQNLQQNFSLEYLSPLTITIYCPLWIANNSHYNLQIRSKWFTADEEQSSFFDQRSRSENRDNEVNLGRKSINSQPQQEKDFKFEIMTTSPEQSHISLKSEKEKYVNIPGRQLMPLFFEQTENANVYLCLFFRVPGSTWSEKIPLVPLQAVKQSGMLEAGAQTIKQDTQMEGQQEQQQDVSILQNTPILLRAYVKEIDDQFSLHEFTITRGVASGSQRTQIVKIEPHQVITNYTGYPMQLRQIVEFNIPRQAKSQSSFLKRQKERQTMRRQYKDILDSEQISRSGSYQDVKIQNSAQNLSQASDRIRTVDFDTSVGLGQQDSYSQSQLESMENSPSMRTEHSSSLGSLYPQQPASNIIDSYPQVQEGISLSWNIRSFPQNQAVLNSISKKLQFAIHGQGIEDTDSVIDFSNPLALKSSQSQDMLVQLPLPQFLETAIVSQCYNLDSQQEMSRVTREYMRSLSRKNIAKQQRVMLSNNQASTYQAYDRIFVLLKIEVRTRAPGSYHIVLSEIGGDVGQHFVNNTFQNLLFRMASEQAISRSPQEGLRKKALSKSRSMFRDHLKNQQQESEEIIEYTSVNGFCSALFIGGDTPLSAVIEFRPNATQSDLANNQNLDILHEQGAVGQQQESKLFYLKIIQGDEDIDADPTKDSSAGLDQLVKQSGRISLNSGITKLVFHPYFENIQVKNRRSSQPFFVDFNVSNQINLSIVDQEPEEIISVTATQLGISYGYNLGTKGKLSRFEVKIYDIQIDDQVWITQLPVVLSSTQKSRLYKDQNLLSLQTIYEPISSKGLLKCPIFILEFANEYKVQISESLIWKVYSFISVLRSSNQIQNQQEQDTSKAIDPELDLGEFLVDDLNLKISFKVMPESRPSRDENPIPYAVMLSLINVDSVKLVLPGFNFSQQQKRYSNLTQEIVQQLRNQLSTVLFRILTDLKNFSSLLGRIGSGISGITDDPNQKNQGMANIGNIQEGFMEGSSALMQGLLRGVTGVVSKPFSGARQEGALGMIKGGVKGIVGLPTNFVGGALGMVSKNLEGFSASINTMSSSNQIKKNRKRLPRAILGDNAIRTFSVSDAIGQYLLRNHQRNASIYSSVMGQSKYQAYRHDKYEELMLLRGDSMEVSRIIMLTNQRLLSFHIPSGSRPRTDDVKNLEVEKVKGRLEKEFSVSWRDFLSADISQDNCTINVFRIGIEKQTSNEIFVSPDQQLVYQILFRYEPENIRSTKMQYLWRAITAVYHKYYLAKYVSPDEISTLPEEFDLPQGQLLPFATPSMDLTQLWQNKGRTISVFRPQGPRGYYSLGDVIGLNQNPDVGQVLMFFDDTFYKLPPTYPRLAPPVAYELIWRDIHQQLAVWRPIAPKGYIELGCVVTSGVRQPPSNIVRCVRNDLIERSQTLKMLYADDMNSGGYKQQISLWQADNQAKTFVAVKSKDRMPPEDAVLKIKKTGV